MPNYKAQSGFREHELCFSDGSEVTDIDFLWDDGHGAREPVNSAWTLLQQALIIQHS